MIAAKQFAEWRILRQLVLLCYSNVRASRCSYVSGYDIIWIMQIRRWFEYSCNMLSNSYDCCLKNCRNLGKIRVPWNEKNLLRLQLVRSARQSAYAFTERSGALENAQHDAQRHVWWLNEYRCRNISNMPTGYKSNAINSNFIHQMIPNITVVQSTSEIPGLRGN